MSHESSVREWKDRAKKSEELAGELEQRFIALQNEASQRLQLMESRLIERERELQDATYENMRLRSLLDTLTETPDEDKPVATFTDISEAKTYAEERQGAGFDIEVELEAEGFHLHGIDREGNVLDADALRKSIEAIKDTHPEHYERLVEEHADVMNPTVVDLG